METIKHDGKIISIIYRDDDWIEGLNFITPNELFVQAGSWWYQKGEILQNHIHTDSVRQGTRTQETVYVKKVLNTLIHKKINVKTHVGDDSFENI